MGTFSRRITLLEAQRDGYGYRIRRPNQSDVGKPQEADDAYKATLSPGDRRRYEALLEPPQSPKARLELPEGMIVEASTEGCVATGRALVYGSVESFLRLFYFPQLMPTKSADH
jgi:hypothetical protein